MKRLVYSSKSPSTRCSSRTVSPTWHVERDLTDYSALLAGPQPGEADLGNLVNDTFTGIISASASLQFYPLERRAAAPRTADIVLPLSDRREAAPARYRLLSHAHLKNVSCSIP